MVVIKATFARAGFVIDVESVRRLFVGTQRPREICSRCSASNLQGTNSKPRMYVADSGKTTLDVWQDVIPLQKSTRRS